MNTESLLRVATFLSIAFLAACGGGGGGAADTTAPTATVTTNAPAAPDPALIEESTVITVTFSESMDTAGGAWQLGGGLAAESNGGVWSTTTVANDTLTISPSGTWFASPGRTLTLNARDLAGNPLATLNLTYDVYRGTLYYVDASRPDNSGNGLNPLTARQFIHSAVADATPSATVLVNAGDYRLSNELGTQVVLRADVSLYGGYNADFTARNPATYITTIEDRSTTGGTSGAPRAAIVGNGSITSVTIVDGFTIQGSTQGAAETAAILLSNGAAPSVRNNTITAGGGDTGSYGIFINASSPMIEHNNIQGGIGGTNSHGIYSSSATPTIQKNMIHGGGVGINTYGVLSIYGNAVIRNNMIHGGSGSSSSRGVGNINCSPIIQNNTIHGGVGNSSVGIFSSGDNLSPARPYIDNNIILARTTGTCIYGAGLSSKPSSLRNNNVWSCVQVFADYSDLGSCPLNDDNDGNGYTCALSEMNVLSGIPGGVGNNISVDPMFAGIDGADNSFNSMADNDWHLSAGSPASVTAGGLNGIDEGWTFTTDKDGVARPASGDPWSIGAYQ